ncbi:MAG: RNA polymerase factor sigma-32 [Deltaproteobacteria bacterium]|nr:RNA polymerase factor sigma-32 [Deltaproteobacteria bacterium]
MAARKAAAKGAGERRRQTEPRRAVRRRASKPGAPAPPSWPPPPVPSLEPGPQEDRPEVAVEPGGAELLVELGEVAPAELGDEPLAVAVAEDLPVELVAETADLVPSQRELPPPPLPSSTALSRLDPLRAYFHELQRYPLLTPEEEQRLTRSYQATGDVKIAARLVTANLRLVVKLAYEYRCAYRNIMDLIQEGNIGLMQAVRRYDPYRGVKLSSYAAWWIRAYMLRFILNNWRLVKLGTTQAQRKLFFNLNKQKALLAAMGIEATAGELAERLGVREKEVVEMDRRLASREASLDVPMGDPEGRPVSRVELIPSNDKPPDEAVAAEQFGQLLGEHLGKFRQGLRGKDLTIFDRRMVAEDPVTLQALGDEFGVSRERMRQIEARLAGRLREYLKGQLGDAVELGV